MAEASIRPYLPEDRERVRYVCYETGYMGEPATWMWRDRESFADLFSGYYTDAEPESALVTVIDGRVSGYLLGCVDTRRVWNPARVVARHAVGRLMLVHPGTAGVLWRSFADAVIDAVRERRAVPTAFLDDRWPSHLHIDLLPVARGQGVGRALLRQWFDRLRQIGSPGCHLETLAENRPAVRFFEAAGFVPHGDAFLVPGLRARDGSRLHLLRMVRSLD